MATRQRRRWIRLRLPSAIVYALLMCVTVAFTVARALPVWAAVGIAVALLVALFIPVRGRVLLVEWITVVSAYLRRRRVAVRRPLPAAADISVLSGDAGIRWDGYTLVAVVEVAPTVALTRESAGHAVSQSALPLDLVASLMTQFGLTLDIDVVSSGSHVPPGTAYRTVYSQLVGPRPVIGVRRTWLVLRLNVADNLAVIL
ncbi:MAG: type VII secretion protein EccE, partial [Gordonia amarae]